MKQKMYQIDAFTDAVFGGNPAAVCVMEAWPSEQVMQQIAQENNLAETAYIVKQGTQYHIRWFTPEIEVDLCGHATLASAYVLFNYYGVTDNQIHFYSPRSGDLFVEKGENGLLVMDFPKDETQAIDSRPDIYEAIGATPKKAFKGKTDYLLIYDSQKEIEQINPNMHLLYNIEGCRGVIVSAPGDEVDFVSRAFFPQCGIPEDPVTGSAHTTTTPYWSKTLGKNKLTAKQLSARGGEIYCEDHGSRIKIAGKAVPYLEGEISI